MSKNITYAIDFGTSNSLLGAVENGKALSPLELDPDNKDKTILRSLMYFSPSSKTCFGVEAINKYIEESGEGRFIRSIKKYLPSQNFLATQISGKLYSLEELISSFLKEMKDRADKYFDHDVTSVVLGRPAKFSLDSEQDKLAQKRLFKSAQMAGFKDIVFLEEPLAAAYDYRKTINSEKIILVVDLGGGTSDFTVIKIPPLGDSKLCVLAMGGLPLAGNALDGCLMAGKIAPHLGSKVKYKMPMSSNVLTMPANLKHLLMSPADITLMSKKDIMTFLKEIKKCALTNDDNEKIENLFFLINENLGFPIFEEIEKLKQNVCQKGEGKFIFNYDDLKIEENFTYEEFLKLSKNKIDSIFEVMNEVLTTSGVKACDIDSICTTGGTSKVPEIKNRLIKIFGKDKVNSHKNFHSVIGGLTEKAINFYL